MALFKSKKKLFAGDADKVIDPPKRSKSINIREADGGFIVDFTHDYESKNKIAGDMDELLKIVKDCFSDKNSKEEK